MAVDGHIHWTQLDSPDRQGTGTKGQSSDGSFTLGTVPKYAADGKLVDSGISPGGGGGTVTHSSGALTADQPVFGNGGADIKVGTKTGNTDQVVTATGSATANRPLLYDASGNAIAGSVQGNTTTVQMASGSATSGYPLLYDASGNAVARQPRGNTAVVQLADSTTNPTSGDLASFDANGNVKDAGFGVPIPVNKGGSGTTTPSLVAGSNVTITGSWPNQTVAASGGTSLPPYIQPATAVPLVASLTKLNQSTGSISDTAAGIYLRQPVGAANYIFAAIQATPAAPWTFTAAMTLVMYSVNFMHMGICCSDGTKITTFGPQFSSGLILAARKMNSATSFNSDYVLSILGLPTVTAPIIWMRIQDDNTNRIYSYSFDGANFLQMLSVVRTDFLTASQVGIFSMINGASVDGNLTCSSWLVSSP